MATIRKLPSGKWNVQIRLQGHHATSKSFLTKSDAERWARQTELATEKGLLGYLDAPRILLGEALGRYLKEITICKKGAAQETRRIKQWMRHPYAKKQLMQLRPVDFANYRDDRLREVSATTVRLELVIISHLYTIALKEWGMHFTNPIQSIRKPAPSKPRSQRLFPDALERLLSSCKQSSNHQLYPLVVLAIETGMRLGELMKSVWKDVDLKSRLLFLRDTKNGDDRIIPLSSKATAILSIMPRDISSQRIFYSWQTTDGFNKAWRNAMKRAGVANYHFHDLRHEATSRLFEKGLSTMEVASITGHKTLQMLQRYTHLRAEGLLEKLG